MKLKFFLIFIIFTSCIVFAEDLSLNENLATDKKNEIQFSVGMFPFVETIIADFNMLTYDNDIHDHVLSSHIKCPTININYLRYIKPSYGLGCTFSIGAPAISTENGNLIYWAIMFKNRLIYLNNKSIKLFGDIGLGFELFHVRKLKDFVPLIAVNIVPLGILFGSNSFFGTLELSIGTEGSVLTAGCGFRF